MHIEPRDSQRGRNGFRRIHRVPDKDQVFERALSRDLFLRLILTAYSLYDTLHRLASVLRNQTREPDDFFLGALCTRDYEAESALNAVVRIAQNRETQDLPTSIKHLLGRHVFNFAGAI